MEISITKPDIPIPASRAPHFHRLHDKYVNEIDGESVDVLDTTLLIEWLAKYKDDPVMLGVIHDVNANAGIGVDLDKLKGGSTSVSDLLVDNREPAGGSIVFPIESVGHLLVHHEKNRNFGRRDVLIAFLSEVGLEPNMIRLKAELCPTCGK